MNNKISTAAFLLTLILFTFSSCGDNDAFNEVDQFNKELAAIDSHIEANNLDAIFDARGIRMVVSTLGTGIPASIFNQVEVDYVGTLFSSGVQFDQGTVNTQLNGLIEGWRIALTSLPEGSTVKLFVPSRYAYKTTNQGKIPANSTLVFDLTFKRIVLTTAQTTRLTSDTITIDEYLASKSLVAERDANVRIVHNTIGTGPKPEVFDRLKLKYIIRNLTNDTQAIATVENEPGPGFDCRPVDFIPGMAAGLRSMQEGGKSTFYIPSGLAFGVEGASNGSTVVIPANSNIIVEMELLEILE